MVTHVDDSQDLRERKRTEVQASLGKNTRNCFQKDWVRMGREISPNAQQFCSLTLLLWLWASDTKNTGQEEVQSPSRKFQQVRKGRGKRKNMEPCYRKGRSL